MKNSTLKREEIQSRIQQLENEKISYIEKNQLIRVNDVKQLTSLGKSTIDLWSSTGKFPKPLILSPTVKVWRLKDVINWINSHSNNGGLNESAN
jgi:predicted DNA-binding transcriptional regulator AlpA